jgi:cysteine desulfuration protein SufE
MNVSSFEKKITSIKNIFSSSKSTNEKYKILIDMGRSLPAFTKKSKIDENIVEGCQSVVYINSYCKNGLIYFEAKSDSLISSGLAYLLIQAYNQESPEIILKFPPNFIKEIGIESSLSMNRANGVYQMYLHMKKQALKFFLQNQKS